MFEEILLGRSSISTFSQSCMIEEENGFSASTSDARKSHSFEFG